MNRQLRFLGMLFIFFCFFQKAYFRPANVFIQKNIFFSKANDILNENKLDSNSNLLFLKEFKIFLDGLSFYNFKYSSIQPCDISNLFNKIDKLEEKFLDANLSEADQKKLTKIAELLRIGISHDLTKDYLIFLKKSLINYLDRILFLIDYWTDQLHSQTLIEKMQTVFGEEAEKTEIKNKIKSLTFLKERIAAYLGKNEEIFAKLNNMNDLVKTEYLDIYSLKRVDKQNIYENITILLKEAIFCVNSLFLENFDPDIDVFYQSLNKFEELSFKEIAQFVSNNHMNLSYMNQSFKLQISNYEIPGFLKKHWLFLTVSGIALTSLGIYTYCYWDEIGSDKPDSLKSKFLGKYENFKQGVNENYSHIKNEFLKKFFPDWADNKTLDENSGLMAVLGPLKNDYEAIYKKLILKKDEPVGIDYNKQLEEIIKTLNETKAKIASQNEDFVKDKELFKRDKELFLRLYDILMAELGVNTVNRLGPIPTDQAERSKWLQDSIAGLEAFLNEYQPTVESLEGSESSGSSSSSASPGVTPEIGILGKLKDKCNPGHWGCVKKVQQFREDTSKICGNTKDIFEKLRAAHGKHCDAAFFDSLKLLLGSLTGIVDDLTPQAANFGLCTQLGVLIVYNMIIQGGMKADSSVKTIQATLNWLRALIPIMLVGTISFVLMRNYIRGKRESRYDLVTSAVGEIYRILNNYNFAALDYYYKELKYKDQGLVSYWIENLKNRVSGVDLKDRMKISKLIEDLQNPELNVVQKLNFIKLEWGTNIF